ncbi:MAG: hypothetical protein JW745_00745 [Sedimentisphaerales bacterium]|nr:hypothetical protein [Sedimentisphaerales bacterium]MBN2843606.1 hypothetical protein [Sedimentisphaerales bacterium]
MSYLCIMLSLSQFPINIATTPASLLWALPVSLGIAVVYKAVKLEKFTWPIFAREVTLLLSTIIGALILTAICLLTIAKIVGIA